MTLICHQPVDFEIRQADELECELIQRICNASKGAFGFVMLPALRKSCRKGELVVLEQENDIGGFIHFHDRRDGVRKIYEMGVAEKFRLSGCGRALIHYAVNTLPTNGKSVQLKCPTELAANQFYEHLGFVELGVEKGRKRELRLWEFRIEELVNNGG